MDDAAAREREEGDDMVGVTIRRELPEDYAEVENLTREAFWNLYVPGCCEHYLAHKMRSHADFLPDLDYVAVAHGEIVGNIMYAKSAAVNEVGNSVETISFGPVSVLPEQQRKGIGSALIRRSLQEAKDRNCKAVIIYGNPKNYCRHGFKSSRDFNVGNGAGKYPFSLLALPLADGIFEGHTWKYVESDVYNCDEKEVEEFDKRFALKNKEHTYSQEEFLISIRAFIE